MNSTNIQSKNGRNRSKIYIPNEYMTGTRTSIKSGGVTLVQLESYDNYQQLRI